MPPRPRRESPINPDVLVGRLLSLAENVSWSWHEAAQRPFAMLEPIAWESTNHAPIDTVLLTSRARIEAAASDPDYLGILAAGERTLADALRRTESADGDEPSAVEATVGRIAAAARIPIDSTPVQVGQGTPSLVTYYTAAIGVMFMLFSALSTTGWLLEEQERGILDRLRSSGIGAWSILLNRFFFATIVGVVQMLVMLAWAAMVFDVWFFTLRQIVSLLVLIPLIAASASALGLLITGVARTRRQQTTIGTIAVLILSALGGSMIPTFLMPQSLQAFGDWFFNARAIGALQQVLWYTSAGDSTIAMLTRVAPAIGVIVLSGIVFLVGARLAISRWS